MERRHPRHLCHIVGLCLGQATDRAVSRKGKLRVHVRSGSITRRSLVWVYYSAQLFFLGAEFTKVYTKTFGSHFSGTLQPSVPRPAATVVTASGRVQVATMSSRSEE